MNFAPLELTLKNGVAVTIRQCETADASALIEVVRSYLISSEHIPLTPSEYTTTTEQKAEWIRSLNNSPNGIVLVATHNNAIIGNIDLTGHERSAFKHTAHMGMGVVEEWRNCGLGNELMRAIIQWAKQNPVLEILWLQVYATHAAGLALYNKHGFVETGRQPSFIKLPDNTYVDKVLMQLSVK